jgi:hypothetical protein
MHELRQHDSDPFFNMEEEEDEIDIDHEEAAEMHL